jgi:peptidoglycan hydrolase CwlO-like protein
MFRAFFWLIIIMGIVVLISHSSGAPFFGMQGRMFMEPFSMVVAIVAIVMVTGVFREIVKQRHDFKSVSQKEMIEIKQHLAGIEADIADIKEQIADFIIKTN